MSPFFPRHLNIEVVTSYDIRSPRHFDDFPPGDVSCFTFETPETWTSEVNLDRSSIMTHGDRSFTSEIFLREMFHVSLSKLPKPESPK
jgi:hypothetical protein